MKTRAYLLNIISGIMFGSSCIFVHFLSAYGFAPTQMTAMRGIVSAVVMAVYILVNNKGKFRTSAKNLILFVLSGLTMFLTATLYYVSMEYTSVSTAVVLMYTAPIFVMVYSVLVFGEKFTRGKLVALIFMISGAGLVSGVLSGLKFNIVGIVAGILSGVSYGAYNIIIKTEMRRNNDPETAMLYCYISMGFFCLFVADFPKMQALLPQNPAGIIPLMLGIGLCTCVIPYFLYTLSMKVLPAGTASALGLIDPMAATLYSVVLFGEPLGIESIIGIILILSAAFILGQTDG